MKKELFLFSLLFCFITVLNAQITEDQRPMSEGVKNGFVLEIPNADAKVVEKTWKKFSKKFKGKSKKDKKINQWFIDNAILPDLAGNNAVDVYATTTTTGDNVQFTTWFDLGGSYLNSYDHPDRVPEAEKMLMTFALQVAKEMTIIELAAEEKTLKSLNQELGKLEKAKANHEKAIEEAKARIAKAEADIEQNIKDQETANGLISDQQGVIEKVKAKLAELN